MIKNFLLKIYITNTCTGKRTNGSHLCKVAAKIIFYFQTAKQSSYYFIPLFSYPVCFLQSGAVIDFTENHRNIQSYASLTSSIISSQCSTMNSASRLVVLLAWNLFAVK